MNYKAQAVTSQGKNIFSTFTLIITALNFSFQNKFIII